VKISIALAAFAAFALSASAAHASQPRVGSSDPAVGGQATRALDLLEVNGLGAFQNYQAVGCDFTATIDHHSQTVTLLIDPAARTIRAENEPRKVDR